MKKLLPTLGISMKNDRNFVRINQEIQEKIVTQKVVDFLLESPEGYTYAHIDVNADYEVLLYKEDIITRIKQYFNEQDMKTLLKKYPELIGIL